MADAKKPFAARLRNQIAIEQSTSTKNAVGESVRVWSRFYTCRAGVEPLMGREYFNGRQEGADVTTRFRIRYKDGITPRMRVIWGSRTFDIDSVQMADQMKKEMILMCRENV